MRPGCAATIGGNVFASASNGYGVRQNGRLAEDMVDLLCQPFPKPHSQLATEQSSITFARLSDPVSIRSPRQVHSHSGQGFSFE